MVPSATAPSLTPRHRLVCQTSARPPWCQRHRLLPLGDAHECRSVCPISAWVDRTPRAKRYQIRKGSKAVIQATVQDRILASPSEVRDAIVDPDRMSGYFTSHRDKPMRSGTTVHWEFADVGGALDVDVDEVDDDHIRFRWDASGVATLVDVELLAHDPVSTVVRITESEWPMDADGVARALEQTAGWTDFLCSLKAYLLHGVNLREGRTADTH
jgi:uncharacterized protein YndB with AHSA1/START domain